MKLTLALALVGASAVLADSTERFEIERRASSTAAKVYTNCKNPKHVALTFDDGPYIYESTVIKDLNAAGIKGTFFSNGNNYDCIYDSGPVASLQAAYTAGHEIASHTWDHPHSKTLSTSAFTTEMTKLSTAMSKILGLVPGIMRPPYGEYSTANLQVLKKLGYVAVTWSDDTLDSDGASVSQSDQIVNKIAKSGKASILLMHETEKTTVQSVLPNAIEAFKAANYTFVTVSECIGVPAYQSETKKFGKRDSSWKC